jgi:hypothetical protein
MDGMRRVGARMKERYSDGSDCGGGIVPASRLDPGIFPYSDI